MTSSSSNFDPAYSRHHHHQEQRPQQIPLHLIYHPHHFFFSTASRHFKRITRRWILGPLRKIFHPNSTLPSSRSNRSIYVNLDLPSQAYQDQSNPNQTHQNNSTPSPKKHRKLNRRFIYATNQVSTTKYSLLTFIPKNLSEQFTRVANVFFLVLVILQFIPKFSQVSPFLACLPLLAVLAITALKDAYEDLRRHHDDRITNNQPVHIIHPTIVSNPNVSVSLSRSHTLVDKIFRAITQHHSRPHHRSKKQATRWSNTPHHHAHPSKTSLSSSSDPSHQHHTGGLSRITWQELRVGDLVMLHNDEPVPADIMICSTSDQEESVCFIETKNLDGETNLKSRHALPQTAHLRSPHDWAPAEDQPANQLIIESQTPHPDLYSYSAAVVFPKLPSNTSQSATSSVPLRVPLDLNSLLLRGTVIRNTEWVIGLVIMTGPDTKITLNSSGTPSKRTRVERLMNPMVFVNLLILALMCIFNGVATHLFETYYYDRGSYWSVGSDLPDDNPRINGVIGFANAMITYQNIVPISLYISIEAVRTIQAYLIYSDDKLAHNGKRTLARSWNLSDDLGQIQYVFSDKTGTLTQNLMQFRECSIGGKVYNGTSSGSPPPDPNDSPILGLKTERVDVEEDATMSGTLIDPTSKSSPSPTSHHHHLSVPSHQTSNSHPSRRPTTVERSSEHVEEKKNPNLGSSSLPSIPFEPFQDSSLVADLAQSSSTQSRMIHGFFATLALCHSVIASETADGTLVYKSQSPDEAALVQTAADVGFVFKGRERNIIRLQVSQPHLPPTKFSNSLPAHGLRPPYPNLSTVQDDEDHTLPSPEISKARDTNAPLDEPTTEVNEYELIEVNAFTSARKRMSVVLKRVPVAGTGYRKRRSTSDQGADDEDGEEEEEELYLLVKGADSVIFERLRSGQEGIQAITDQDLETFASKGFRTLCLGYKRLERVELDDWLIRLHEAMSSIEEDRDQKIELVQDEIEQDLILLGATAIEDKLQDGVPQAIEELRMAGIHVWVATGDKLETAVAIAKSCNLITPDMNLIVVRGGAYGQKSSAYNQIKRALVEFFDGQELIGLLKEHPPDQDPPHTPTMSISSSQNSNRRRRTGRRSQDDLESIVGRDNGERIGGYGLVIDGLSLNSALNEPFTRELLMELSTRCQSVVCCRSSPKHKAEIVKMVKDGFNGEVVTLAIGDGANDVSMIQTADIGVGVQGEEGLQAINSSDYSVHQFKDLNRLLFVHGNWSFDRNSKMIMNFFHKEIIGISVLFLFQFWCGYSTTTFYEYTYLLFYNVFWTLLPVLAIGIFDQNVREKVLVNVPYLYSTTRDGRLFSMSRFMIYMAEGTYQGMIIYGLMMRAYDAITARQDGFDVGMYEFSTTVIVAVIWVSNLFNGFNLASWNWWCFWSVAFGPVLILLYTGVYSAIKPGWIWTPVYGNNHYLWASVYWWLGIALSIVVSMLPRLVWKYYQINYYPTDMNILKCVDKMEPDYDFQDGVIGRRQSFAEEKGSAADEEQKKRSQTTLEKVESGNALAGEAATCGASGRPEMARSRTSFAHDMATGGLSPNISSRGFNFDQADGVGELAVGNRLRRYNTSLLSFGRQETPEQEHRRRIKARKKLNRSPSDQLESGRDNERHKRSMRIGNLEFAFGHHRASNRHQSQHRRSYGSSRRNSRVTEEAGTDGSAGHGQQGGNSLVKRISGFLHPPAQN